MLLCFLRSFRRTYNPIMLSRFCKLCHNKVDIPLSNLRRYRVSPVLLRQKDDEDATPVHRVDHRIPIITAKHRALNFYKGRTFNKFETIPIASKGWHHSKSFGDYFTILPLKDTGMNNERADPNDPDGPDKADEPEEPMTFQELQLHPALIENLRNINITTPTEIQINAIPMIMEQHHTILSAETGCGKTFAFLLPILNHILAWKRMKQYEDRGQNRPFGMIITPSRELALQITDVAKNLVKDLDIDVKVLTGTKSRAKLLNPSIRNVDLLIGTFGIMSKMITNKIYKLDNVRHVVLDEAHALFHETFDDKLEVLLRRIIFHDGIPNADPSAISGAQLTLVSATKPSEMPEYISKILEIQSMVDVSTNNFHRVMVPQKFLRVAVPDKSMTLLRLIKPKAMKNQRIVIFSNDSSTCDWLSLFLNEFNIRAIHLNGDMPLVHRKGKFMAFQNNTYNVLSTTNAGARGLDTVDVNVVVNYDFPLQTAEYIHRCGRTGRVGSKCEGRVINFISRPYEIELAQKIERAARRMRPLPIMDIVHEKLLKKAEAQARAELGIRPKPSKTHRKTRKGAKDRKKKKVIEATV